MSTTAIAQLESDIGDLVEARRARAGGPDFSRYAGDPCGFIGEVLGETNPGLWSGQVEIAEAVRDRPFVVVLGCNASGKDFLAARLALWWTFARRGFVIITGPTQRQVQTIVMAEVRRAFHRARDLHGELFQMALRVPGQEQRGILALTSTEASRLTGFHAPRLLTILTEAQAVEDFAWEGLLSCRTGAEDRTLAVGNPLAPTGRYYTVSRAPHWHRVEMPATTHPNVVEDRTVIPGGPSRAWIESIIREYGEGSPQKAARVDARFPTVAESALVRPESWDAADDPARACEELARLHSLQAHGKAPPARIAIDVAREGSDSSAAAVRWGNVLLRLERWRERDVVENTRRVAALVKAVIHQDGIPARVVVVDEAAVGGGVHDGLRPLLAEVGWSEQRLNRLHPDLVWVHVRVEGFMAARAAKSPSRFGNAKAQVFWELRSRFESGDALIHPRVDRSLLADLREELLAHEYRHRTDDRIEMLPKDEVRSRIGRSPDLADSAAMTFWPDVEAERVKGGDFFILP